MLLVLSQVPVEFVKAYRVLAQLRKGHTARQFFQFPARPTKRWKWEREDDCLLKRSAGKQPTLKIARTLGAPE